MDCYLNIPALSYIGENVGETSKTLETGAGISTILFALKNTRHICITPDEDEVNHIRELSGQYGISLEKVDFEIERSETALPRLKSGDLDFILIDGRHAFPTPFIDWFYASSRLKTGGLLMIDDTLLYTGRVLKDFLLLEPEWGLEKDFRRTSVFIKLKEYSHKNWWKEQPYIARHSKIGKPAIIIKAWAHAPGFLKRIKKAIFR